MTDKEMLEWAAKASGYEYAKFGGYIVVDGIPGNWNPLSDDGDALRLAVALKISVTQDFDRVDAYNNVVTATEYIYEKPTPTDRPAATRRAIVCAAAEIGKEMEG